MIIFLFVILLIWCIINSGFIMIVKSQLDDFISIFWNKFGDKEDEK